MVVTRLLRILPVVAMLMPSLSAQLLPLIGDAQVSTAYPSTNFGALPFLQVGGPSAAYVIFDSSALAGVNPTSVAHALLTLWTTRVGTAGAVDVFALSGSWNESTITFGNLPVTTGMIGTMPTALASVFVSIDITPQVKKWISTPASNNGLMLSASATAPSTVVFFDSKESVSTSHAPQLQIVLNSGSGPAGPQGAAGVAGPSGATGPVGQPGATGLVGLTGTAGAAGIVGTAGPVGPSGVAGLTGAIGSAGIAGAAGAAGPTGPSGLAGAPGATGTNGPAGAAGLAGPAGLVGHTGATGSVGAKGAAGAAGIGLNWRGTYSSANTYAIDDAVFSAGSSYVSLQSSNTLNTPPPAASNLFWNLLALNGAAGLTGPIGVPGPTGAAGVVGAIGPAGATGKTGVAGPTGLGGPSGPSTFTHAGQRWDGATLGTTYYFAPFNSPHSTSETSCSSNNYDGCPQILFFRGCTLQNLTAATNAAPGGTLTISVRTGVNQTSMSTALSCTIAATGVLCNSGSNTVPVSAYTLVGVQVAVGGSTIYAGTYLNWGFECN